MKTRLVLFVGLLMVTAGASQEKTSAHAKTTSSSPQAILEAKIQKAWEDYKNRNKEGFAAILANDAMAAEDQVRSRFVDARSSVSVGGDAATRLIGHQLPAIGCLADDVVARRKIEKKGSAAQRLVATGRDRHPQVFANFDADGQSRRITGLEE